MGCASSTLLNQEQEFSQIGGSAAFSHHIVSLTSTTYGLLSLDPPPSLRIEDHSSAAAVDPPSTTTPAPRKRITLGSLFPSPLSEPRSIRFQPMETINTWDLMSGIDSDRIPSFRFSISPTIQSKPPNSQVEKQLGRKGDEENLCPNSNAAQSSSRVSIFKKLAEDSDLFTGFEQICPLNGEDKVVVYTTTLRGVRKTFEDCNAVRAAIQGLGISFCERDVSMDRGFRDELRELMKAKGSKESIPPRVFVIGRYIGGVEEVMRLLEEGCLGELLKGLPKMKSGYVCEGCGGVRFLPCSTCNGSCKLTLLMNEDEAKQGRMITVKCSKCNENGLVLCPVCS